MHEWNTFQWQTNVDGREQIGRGISFIWLIISLILLSSALSALTLILKDNILPTAGVTCFVTMLSKHLSGTLRRPQLNIGSDAWRESTGYLE